MKSPKPRQRARTRKMRVWVLFRFGKPSLPGWISADREGADVAYDRGYDYRTVTLLWQEPRRKR